MMRDQSANISNDQYLVSLTTQGISFDSKFNPSGMSPYMVESVLTGSGLVERDVFSDFAKTNHHIEAWKKWGSGFIGKLIEAKLFFDIDAINGINEVDSQSFMFEAICRFRQDSFNKRFDSLGGQEHTELAMSYDKSMLYFLGTSICSKFAYIPHMIYREICMKTEYDFPSIFREPLWWYINDKDGESTVSDILRGMSEVLRGQSSKFELLEKFPPSNINFDPTDQKVVDDTPLDIEGLVLMTPKLFTDKIDNQKMFEELDCRDLDYSKAKTNEYYKCHKFKIKNVEYYMELHNFEIARQCFPIVVRVAFFFGPGNLTTALQMIGDQTIALLDGTAIDPATGQTYRSKYISSFPQKALKGFDTRSIDTQCRMLINVGNGFAQDLLPIFCSAFPSISVDPERASDITGIFRSAIMELKPWDTGTVTNTSTKSTKSESTKSESTKTESIVDMIDSTISFLSGVEVTVEPSTIEHTVVASTEQVVGGYSSRISNLDRDSRVMRMLASLVLGFNI
jgi:hypothetical protein